jgi:hypothetical protein
VRLAYRLTEFSAINLISYQFANSQLRIRNESPGVKAELAQKTCHSLNVKKSLSCWNILTMHGSVLQLGCKQTVLFDFHDLKSADQYPQN